MRHHRYQLISNQPKITPSRGTRGKTHWPSTMAMILRSWKIDKVSSAKFLDYPSRKKSTTNHSRKDDLKQEKYQKIIPVDSNGVPVRSVKQVLYPESLGFHSEGSTLVEGPNDYIMRAVDQAWETPAKIPNSHNKPGRYRYLKSGQEPALSTKPESKRFQRLNKNLHKLMETEYLPNNKLSHKLKVIRSQSATVEANNPKTTHRGRLMTTMSLPGSRQNTRIKMHDSRKSNSPSSPVRYGGKENFLEMIMDMDEKVATLE